MAITTYTELKSAIADELNRQDLTTVIPNFISLAEARLNRDLRVRQMVKRATALTVAGDRYLQLPADWQEAKNLTVAARGRNNKLDYVTLDYADDYNADRADTPGVPMFFNVTGADLELVPKPDAVYTIEMTYYGRIAALSATTASNWLLAQWPDIYLYGSLIHSAPYLKEDDRMNTWSAIYDRLTSEIRVSDERAQYSGSVLQARTRNPY